MAYISFEQVAASGSVQTETALTIPANATMAEIQASAQNVRYTMDGATNPTASSGMRLLATAEQPKTFVISDLANIRFIQESATGQLNIHYFSGRDI